MLGFWLTGGIAALLLSLLGSLEAFVVGRVIQGESVLQKWDFFPGVRLFEKLSARTIPLIIVLVILALMTVRIVIFAHCYVTED